MSFPFWFLVLYWSLQGKMAEFRMFKSICEVQTSAFQLLGSMCKFNTGLQWYGQQFPCILCIASPKSLLRSCGFYNLHEKSLIEGESELNYQTHRGQRGKKHLISLHISTILTQKKNDCKFCLSLWAFDNSIYKKITCESFIFGIYN